MLFTGVVGLAAGLLDILASTQLISAVAILALLVPSIAVSLRRLHDTDRSGWMYLLVLIPLVGPILMLVFFVSEGTAGPNRFGPSPKALAA